MFSESVLLPGTKDRAYAYKKKKTEPVVPPQWGFADSSAPKAKPNGEDVDDTKCHLCPHYLGPAVIGQAKHGNEWEICRRLTRDKSDRPPVRLMKAPGEVSQSK